MGAEHGPVRLIPLGGIGEIGKNMLVIENDAAIIVVDAGIMFPDDQLSGIDFIIPKFDYLLENREKVRAIFLTHGHEDHIGALPYLLKELPVPVYGTRLTLGFARNRLEEHNLPEDPEFHEIRPRERVIIRNLQFEFFRVCHSVADGVGFALHTPHGIILHTGDFKVDFTPVHEHHLDFFKLAEFGEKGVLLLMSDSTNAEQQGYTPSEMHLGNLLFDTLYNARGRVIISTFASNIHRIQQILDQCERASKKVCILGRSMERNVTMARDLGYLHFQDSLVVPLERIKNHPRNGVVLLTTGTQGEPMSVLSQIATDRHKLLSVEEDDTVILSASIIPGNEKTVSAIINSIFKRGARVLYEGFEDLHVSGHASREELKLMIALTRPRYFIPVHGEFRHLIHHSDLAKEMGIREENIILAENGNVIQVDEGGVSVKGRVGVGSAYIGGRAQGSIENGQLAERYRIAEEGMIIVAIPITPEDRGVLEPKVCAKGFIHLNGREELLQRAQKAAFESVRRSFDRWGMNTEQIKIEVRNALEDFFRREASRRPVIVPIVVEV
jgi:ribonuclease J